MKVVQRYLQSLSGEKQRTHFWYSCSVIPGSGSELSQTCSSCLGSSPVDAGRRREAETFVVRSQSPMQLLGARMQPQICELDRTLLHHSCRYLWQT